MYMTYFTQKLSTLVVPSFALGGGDGVGVRRARVRNAMQSSRHQESSLGKPKYILITKIGIDIGSVIVKEVGRCFIDFKGPSQPGLSPASALPVEPVAPSLCVTG